VTILRKGVRLLLLAVLFPSAFRVEPNGVKLALEADANDAVLEIGRVEEGVPAAALGLLLEPNADLLFATLAIASEMGCWVFLFVDAEAGIDEETEADALKFTFTEEECDDSGDGCRLLVATVLALTLRLAFDIWALLL
jgi:hypothetical protein